jgi:hypothetical protein
VTDHQVDLLSAWSTFGAALLAAAASFFAFRAYVKESRLEKRIRDSDERAQASLVAAWLGWDPEPDLQARNDGNWLVIRNASQTPIYNVTWWIHLSSESVAGEPLPVVPPSAVGEIYQPPLYLHTKYGFEDSDLPTLLVGIQFTDSAGVKWHRAPNGQLHQHGYTKPLNYVESIKIDGRVIGVEDEN